MAKNYLTCFGLLHEGIWRQNPLDFVPRFNSTLNVSLAGNASLTWTGPSSCEYKIYEPSSLKTCLSKNYPRVQIIGDSRARQYWSAMKPLLADDVEENFVMFDSAWNMPKENSLVVNSTGLIVNQAWVDKFRVPAFRTKLGVKPMMRKRLVINEDEAPDVIIMTALILHTITQFGIEDSARMNNIEPRDFFQNKYQISFRSFKDPCFYHASNLGRCNFSYWLVHTRTFDR